MVVAYRRPGLMILRFQRERSLLPREFLGSVAYDGFLYIMGGNDNGVLENDVQYASISGGSLAVPSTCPGGLAAGNSIWCLATSFTTARQGLSAVAYNGFMYILGGIAGSSTGGCTATNYYCNDVQIDNINTNGALGSTWTDDTSLSTGAFTTARDYFSATAYNGYMYIMGGNANGTYQNDVQYAAIGGNGAMLVPTTCAGGLATGNSIWCKATAFTTARQGLASVAYNGYMYILGGLAASSAGGCTSTNYYCNDSQYDNIQANGALGATWTDETTAATGAFTTSREFLGAAINDGYMYIMGGNANGTYQSDVQYAAVSATGSNGVFNTATAFTTARQGLDMVAYNGYIYMVGGLAASSAGGCANTGFYCNDVQYNSISPAGITGAYTTNGTTFTTAVEGAQVVAYNGYLYVMGGDAGGLPTNTIYFGSFAANGSVGTLTTTGATAFTTVRTDFAAVAFNGYMYVLGGCNNTLANCATTAADDIATVYSSPIAAAGTLGAWTVTTSFTTGRYGLGAFVAPAATYTTSITGYMYIVGGVYYNGTTLTYLKDVQYGPITSVGAVSSWTAVAVGDDLNNARAFFGTAVYGGYVYVVGGKGASVYNNVEYAPVSSSGGITSAFTVTSGSSLFTNARQNLGAVADNGYLYLAGGYNGTTTYYADTQYAPINSNGSIGAWATTTSFANASYGVGMAAYNGYVYVGGGFNGTTYYNDVYYAPINNGGPGTLQTWTTMGTGLLNNVTLAGAAVYNNYIYLIGGWCGSCSDPTTNIQYVKINPNGSLATPWVDTTNLLLNTAATYNDTYPVYGVSAVAYNGYLYAVGGETYPSQNVVKVVEYALICTGSNNGVGGCNSTAGNVGTWAAVNSLPAVSGYGIAKAYNGYMYDMGGFNSQYGNSSSVAVDYVLICTGSNSGVGGCSATPGTLGTWTATTSLPQATNNASGVIYDGYIYQVGGAGSAVFNSVYYALICNGSNNGVGGCSTTAGPIGTWYATTSIIFPASYGQAVASDGYLYDIGGYTSAATAFTAVAPINNNGTIGNWTETASLPSVSTQDQAVVNNGFVYDLGEGSTGASPSWTVTYTGINAMPRVGLYSDKIDFTGLSGDDPTPIEMQTDGGDCSSGACNTTLTNPNSGNIIDGSGGGIYVNYQFATNACTTYNASTTIPTLPNLFGLFEKLTFTTNGCAGTTNIGRYMWVSFILDDSNTASFPDSLGNHSSITDFTVYYHPAASNRLRGGTTFSNSALQTLDAPP